jgi:hypothetical protein
MGSVGGTQVAAVKMSTAFRTKKRGNVPPRFETLFVCQYQFSFLSESMQKLRGYAGERGKLT